MSPVSSDSQHGDPLPLGVEIGARLARAARWVERRWSAHASRLAPIRHLGVAIMMLVLVVGDWLVAFGAFRPRQATALSSGSDGVIVAAMILAVGAFVAMLTRERLLSAAVGGLAIGSLIVTVASLRLDLYGAPSLSVLVAVSLLSARAARIERVDRAVLLVAGAGFTVVSEAWRLNESPRVSIAVLFLMPFSFWVGVGLYRRWTAWQRITTAREARSHERTELAGELHDLVGHYVTAIVVQAQAAKFVAAQNPNAALDALDGIEAAGSDAMAAIRRLVGNLRDDAPTAPAASWEDVDELITTSAAMGEPVHAVIEPAVRDDLAIAASVHRLIAESLTNVRKHAAGVTAIDVTVSAQPGQVVIEVLDDGQSPTTPAEDSFGIISMRERCEALGGTLVAGPRPGGGWSMRAVLESDVVEGSYT